MALNFTAKKVLVTGAGRGIGRTLALSLAKSGAKVYALSKTKSTLDTLVQESPNIVPLVQDVSKWNETRSLLKQIEPLDGLVNNAAILKAPVPALECTKEEFDSYLQNNLLSCINCIQVVANQMIESGKSGSIVYITGIVSKFPLHGIGGYAVSKAALEMVTKQFSVELGEYNIRVNSVNPTLIMTDMVKDLVANTDGGLVRQILDSTPLPRLPNEEDIAGPVMYLLSDLSSMVTGTSHFVDGGITNTLTAIDKLKTTNK